MPPMAESPSLYISTDLSTVLPSIAGNTCTSPLFSRGYSFSGGDKELFNTALDDGDEFALGMGEEADLRQPSLRSIRDSRRARRKSTGSFGSTLPTGSSQIEFFAAEKNPAAAAAVGGIEAGGGGVRISVEEESAVLGSPERDFWGVVVRGGGQGEAEGGSGPAPRSSKKNGSGTTDSVICTPGRALARPIGRGGTQGVKNSAALADTLMLSKKISRGDGRSVAGAPLEAPQYISAVDVGGTPIEIGLDCGSGGEVDAWQQCSSKVTDASACDVALSSADARLAGDSVPPRFSLGEPLKRGRKRKNPELSEDERKAVRQAQNRENAKQSRLRRLRLTENYKNRAEVLEVENKQLRFAVAALEDRLGYLQKMIVVTKVDPGQVAMR